MIIETLWKILDNGLKTRLPEEMEGFWKIIKHGWHTIKKETTINCVTSITTRMQMIVKWEEGWLLQQSTK